MRCDCERRDMERQKRKAINFDLDTNKMKEMDLYPNGYKLLGASLKKRGFEHRQGSGYVSKERMDSVTVARIIESITKEQRWLAKCVNKIDVTDIGRQHDLTDIVKTYIAPKDELKQANESEDLENLEENDSLTLTM